MRDLAWIVADERRALFKQLFLQAHGSPPDKINCTMWDACSREGQDVVLEYLRGGFRDDE